MTKEESIETIKNMDTSEFGDAVHQALNMAIEALEKQIPRKLKINACSNAWCPNCSCVFGYIEVIDAIRNPEFHAYCNVCGQSFDWSEDE